MAEVGEKYWDKKEKEYATIISVRKDEFNDFTALLFQYKDFRKWGIVDEDSSSGI